MSSEDLIGKVYETKHYGYCTVVSLVNRKNITIEFSDGHRATCTLQNLKRGSVFNPFHPKVYGVGFIGVGEYSAKIGKSIHPFYEAWRGSLRRCYDPKAQKKRPNYIGCSVHSDWHNYQDFCKWSEEEVFFTGYKLDKDLLVANNKVYSPDTCVYLPNELNCMISNTGIGGRELPKGVSLSSNPKARSKIYVANLQRKTTNNYNLGYFDNPEEAHAVYKMEKEKYVKERAMFWRENISTKAFDALMCWTLPE